MAIKVVGLEKLMKTRRFKKQDLRNMGLSPGTIAKIFSNNGILTKERRIDSESINRICECLQCQPGSFLKYVPDEKEKEEAQ